MRNEQIRGGIVENQESVMNIVESVTNAMFDECGTLTANVKFIDFGYEMPFTAKYDIEVHTLDDLGNVNLENSDRRCADLADFIISNEVEVLEYTPPVIDIQELKTAKLAELHAITNKFEENINKDMWFISSLGFKCGGDRREKANFADFIEYFDKYAVDGVISYRAYNNEDEYVTKEQLQLLKAEHVLNGFRLYQQKWAFENLIENARTVEDLDVIKLVFEMTDYTKD